MDGKFTDADIPSPEEWKNVASRFYNEATGFYKYQIVEFPAAPQNPLSLVRSYPLVDMVSAHHLLPEGTKVFSFEDVFANEDAMNQLMSFAVRQYFPEDE
jgi:hypothetical protein